jgi:hypothetical protein
MPPISNLLVRNGRRLIISAARRAGATAGDNLSQVTLLIDFENLVMGATTSLSDRLDRCRRRR